MADTIGLPEMQLHPSRAVPLYYSLALGIEAAIDDGRISLHDNFESVSVLHHRVRLSAGTVRRAFRHLEERGVVRRTSRSTFTVVALPNSGSTRAASCKELS
ncbi:GntR family transcriptional regulator [Rhodococcoides kyotonense]|uniref:Regulatory protein, gntR family n=1 Tax=Rhodococcoides kyotonense TaxID=398843 RepID=A0A239M050_9NOCA|nr:GntR family transcriptional regulator [Rhodococcus kyotonensis]SNT35279.1 regulatory protein, gntR family [Rhodococcus kyotonensis]